MQLYLRDLYLGTYYQYYMFRSIWAIFRNHVYKNVKRTACLNKGHADIGAYKGVFIYLLRYSATECTNQELRYCISFKGYTAVIIFNMLTTSGETEQPKYDQE
jgi:hypothetical protein